MLPPPLHVRLFRPVEAGAWTLAATGMPDIPIAGLTLVPGQALYAATYGQGAWSLSLK